MNIQWLSRYFQAKQAWFVHHAVRALDGRVLGASSSVVWGRDHADAVEIAANQAKSFTKERELEVTIETSISQPEWTKRMKRSKWLF
ncbi:MAG: hypothetical protein H7Z11_21360 [Verrucomicrobia bacterium]|nr:hypothetical protein [Leptolyngbya sp. ES-bin-22]